MFVGTVSSRRVMLLFWMTTTSGLAVAVATEVGMVAAGFSEVLRPGRSAYRVFPYGRWSLRSMQCQMGQHEVVAPCVALLHG